MATASDIKRRSARLKRHAIPASLGRWQVRACATVGVAIAIALGSLSLAELRAADVAKAPSQQTALAPAAWANDLSPIAPADWNYHRAAHLLERAGFGGAPEEIEKLAAMTPAEAVDYLVDYESFDDSHLPVYEPSDTYPLGYKFGPGLGAAERTGKAVGITELGEGKLPFQPAVTEWFTLWYTELHEMTRGGQWWAERMLKTPRPLEEKLTLFWHGHFATSQQKVRRYEDMLDQIQTLRTHANGNFHEMLVAVAQDPAMLDWLDNRRNVKGKPNENFAREVMELFTMGEGQGYTESDIREIARAFTGWTMTSDFKVEDTSEFVNDPERHDEGAKNFLGASGNFDGYDAIRIILEQEATPRFISGKLYRFFVRETAAPEVHEQLAKTLLDANYELKPLLKAIFLSRDFYSEPSYGTLIKSPVHLVISTYRRLGLKEMPGIPDFDDTTDKLGQRLFFPPNVAGWVGGRTWINPATLLMRGNFAYGLLFPDPDSFIAPDKVVVEEYRKIPFKYPDYELVCHIWNPKTQRMEPASYEEYEQFLARVAAGPNAMTADALAGQKPDRAPSESVTTKYSSDKKPKSALVRLATREENSNRAVAVWEAYVKMYDSRVKPIPRTTAQVLFVPMVKAANVSTVEEAVDYFCRRFLQVDLHSDRRLAVVDFLQQELDSDTLDYDNDALEHALRRVVHLILSSPEYQLG